MKDTIDFLLNCEAFNRIQDTGSQKGLGVTKDSRLYFDLSSGKNSFNVDNPQAPSFNQPNKELVTK